jgi:hypothetical protein
MTGQGRQGSIIQSRGAKVQDGRQAQGQVRQRSVIHRWGKGTGWQAGSGAGKGQNQECEKKRDLGKAGAEKNAG